MELLPLQMIDDDDNDESVCRRELSRTLTRAHPTDVRVSIETLLFVSSAKMT